MPVDSRIALSGIAPPLMSMGQLAGLQQIGDERNKQANLVKLNQLPGMVEKGLYTDQGLIGLSQIDPALRDRATLMRENVLKSRMEADRKLEEEKVALGTDIAAEAMAQSLEEPNPTARQAVFQKALNESVDRIERDGTADKFGITPEGLRRMRSLSPSDAMLNLQKHGRYTTDQRGDYLAGKERRNILRDVPAPETTTPGAAPDPNQSDPNATAWQSPEGEQPGSTGLQPWFNRPWEQSGQLSPEQPMTRENTDIAAHNNEWVQQEREALNQAILSGQMDNLTKEEVDAKFQAIDEEAAAKLRNEVGVVGHQSKSAPVQKQARVAKDERQALLDKADYADAQAEAIRQQLGDKGSQKAVEALKKESAAYRRAADALTRADQKDRSLDQADRRMDISESRMKQLMAGADYVPGEINNMAMDLLMFGKEPRGYGPAGNKIRQDVHARRAVLAEQLGLTPDEVAMLPQDNKIKMKAVDKLTTWGAFVDKSSEQLSKSLDLTIAYAEKFNPGQMRALNKLILAGEKEFNDPIANAYAVQINTIRMEYGRLMAGPTSNAMLPVEAMKKGDDLISGAMDVATLREVGRAIRNDARITRTAIENQIGHLRTGMGGTKEKYQEKSADLEPIGGRAEAKKPGGPATGPKAGSGWSTDKERAYQQWKKDHGY